MELISAPPGGVLIWLGNAAFANESSFQIKRGVTSIGRSEISDIQLFSSQISRIHAALTWEGDSLFIVPHSKTNPTVVNGIPLFDPIRIGSGDVIELAEDALFRVELFDDIGNRPTVPNSNFNRRLVSVISADVVNFSKSMEIDEKSTLTYLEECQNIFRNQITNNSGKIVNITGDSILAIFTSVLLSVSTCVRIQEEIENIDETNYDIPKMRYRIGINSGDVLFSSNNDIQGDAVNISARIQSIADPGSVFVSHAVYEQIATLDLYNFEYNGAKTLKNISREISIYKII